METFLDKVAKHLIANYPEQLSDLCIVFPNRRAGLFFKASMAQVLKKSFIAPTVFSIEDFVEELSQKEKLDPIAQLFTFYKIYRDINKDKSESLDEFLKWAPTLLADYNEIDSYLVDPKKIFGNLKDIKELENWSLGVGQLTDFQKKYLEFWELLGVYYEKFTVHLNAKQQSYQGLSYRNVAANIDTLIANVKWHKVIFAGFNALTLAEEKILKTLVEKNKAEVLWDCDSYYVENVVQEAGKFIRKHKARAIFGKSFNWQENLLATDKKNITIIGAPKNISQVKLAGDLVDQFSINTPDLTNTAVVLADEKLLIPLLNSFPENVSSINVTMGYPLKNSPLFTLIELIFNLHENMRKDDKNQPEYYHRNVIDLLSHPFISRLNKTEKGSDISSYIQKENLVFVSYHELLQISNNNFIKILFKPWNDVTQSINSFIEIIFELRKAGTNKSGEETNASSLDTEFLFSFFKLLKRVNTLREEFDFITDIKTFRKILVQLVQTTNLSFYGEPLRGLQVMGMLETRTLDFENVIMLSVNERILPAAKQSNSFIPFDVKRAFGLPTYSDKDSIYAFHFYRILQRAKNIFLVYNTEADSFNTGEKSRFIAQLLHELKKENPNILIKEKTLEIPESPVTKDNPIVIEKNAAIIEKLDKIAEKGFSPTSLNKFRNCSLQYYFSAIAGLSEENEVEEVIEADTLGSAIHSVLEEIYKPLTGKIISATELKEHLTKVESYVFETFTKLHKKKNLAYGKNLLVLKVASKFISTCLKKEIEDLELLKKNNKYITLIDLEKELTRELTIAGKKINFKGKADRIEQQDGSISIVDYKTGKADDSELNVKDWNELISSQKLNKSFQLLMYAWLYNKPVRSGIITFRELSSGLKTVKIDGTDQLNETVLDQFGKIIEQLISAIYDVSQPFKQTEDVKVCEYCSFKSICSR